VLNRRGERADVVAVRGDHLVCAHCAHPVADGHCHICRAYLATRTQLFPTARLLQTAAAALTGLVLAAAFVAR